MNCGWCYTRVINDNSSRVSQRDGARTGSDDRTTAAMNLGRAAKEEFRKVWNGKLLIGKGQYGR